MNVFSFRAECALDMELFLASCVWGADIAVQATFSPISNTGDIGVEVETAATLTMLQEVMRGIEDSHVMLQTLRQCPLAENSLEREYGLE